MHKCDLQNRTIYVACLPFEEYNQIKLVKTSQEKNLLIFFCLGRLTFSRDLLSDMFGQRIQKIFSC